MNTPARPPTIDGCLNAPASPQRQKGGRRFSGRGNLDPRLPLASIVTIVRNGSATIAQTLDAVKAQTYRNVEYVVIDGASSDGTVEILRAYEEVIDCWISEPDSGPVTAMNKAIAHTTGDYVFMLSANDWIPPEFIENGVRALRAGNADFVFGDVMVHEGDEPQLLAPMDPDYARNISWLPSMAPGVTILRRKLFEQLGLFDPSYKFASDIEWMVRVHAHGARGVHDSALILNYRRGGFSEVHYLSGLLDVRRAVVAHGFSRTKATLGMLYRGARYLLKRVLHGVLPESAFNRIMRFSRKAYSKPLTPPASG
jgi:glycosyltransferase involved in cell wall biosynthesis